MTDSTPYLLSVAGGGIALLLVLVINPAGAVRLAAAGQRRRRPGRRDSVGGDRSRHGSGMGKVLAHVAPIVGLGAMLGKMLELSGGAQRIADRLLRLFGERRAPLALGVTGLHLRYPSLLRRRRRSCWRPWSTRRPCAGGSRCCTTPSRWPADWRSSTACCPRTRGPSPPRPAPRRHGADHPVRTVCAVPAWFLGGYLFSRWISERIFVPIPDYVEEGFHDESPKGPAAPCVCRVTGRNHGRRVRLASGGDDDRSAAGVRRSDWHRPRHHPAADRADPAADTFSSILIDDEGNPVQQVLGFIGAPMIALLVAVLVSFYVLGVRRGW